ncbi:MAG TPA: type II secretion system F family protein [Anaerolineae bacterium]|nr:type II secretion system F family protein [Anaerolineae bacterium]
MNPLYLLVGGVVVFLLGGMVVAFVTSRRTSVDSRLEEFVGRGYVDEVADEYANTSTDDIADRVDKSISERSFFVGMKQKISRADAGLRVSEYIGIIVLATIGGAVGGYFAAGPVFAVVGLVIGNRLPNFMINRRGTKRLRSFDEQLGDTLNLWVNSLRSGYSVLQGMEAIATELSPPVSKEFERVVQEVRLGLTLEDSLNNLLRRIPSEDLDLVVTAVNIQREVGGNLAEILDIISFTIRERVRIKGEIRTLTSQGRASGWIITVLPILLGLVLYMINPDYIMELFVEEPPFIIPGILPCGWLIVGTALMMIAAGGYAIQRIVDIEV